MKLNDARLAGALITFDSQDFGFTFETFFSPAH
jgi:hypothetical protein